VETIVAAVQFSPILLDVATNLKTALRLTFEAAVKGAAVVVLPELSLTGHTLTSPEEACSVAQTSDGPFSMEFAKIARNYNCHIVFGYVELNDGFLFNSAAVVGPFGLDANAQKHNLHGSDFLWARHSTCKVPNVLTRAGRLGVLVCKDASNRYRESAGMEPDHRFYRRGDVDVIALPTNWGTEFSYPDATWMSLAESTSASVIVSNRGGQERDIKFQGGSCVISRDLQVSTHGSSFFGEAVVGGLVTHG
jgi:predicted amidohydrolase